LAEFTLWNRRGDELVFTPRGAALARWRVGGADVVLGFPDPARYDAPHPQLGSIVGRFANRIAFARFALDGREHALSANDGAHHLHGGADGFARRLWRGTRDGDALCFRLDSPDGDQGYPGRLEAEVRYALDDDALRIDLRARSDRATVVSLASHAYWNLRDGGATPVLDHELEIAADRYLPVDAAGIPSGEIAPVRDTPLDLTRPTRIGAHIADALLAPRGGHDHCFALRGTGLRLAARLADPASGRVLEVETTQPGVQLYSGNFLDGSLVGHGGARYARYHGLCLETQGFPDAPNQPHFPSARLEPGAEYAHTTIYRLILP
jgi:aldose 1-epimerase